MALGVGILDGSPKQEGKDENFIVLAGNTDKLGCHFMIGVHERIAISNDNKVQGEVTIMRSLRNRKRSL
jgi:hypothetical protein